MVTTGPYITRKHSRVEANIYPLSYAMLSGLSEISLCIYRSVDSISGGGSLIIK
jgi:hypothetical protein